MNRTFRLKKLGFKETINGILSLFILGGLAQEANGQTYCTATNTSSTTYYISSFTTTGGLSNISNTGTTFSASGYGNYTSMTASAFQGNNITIDAEAGPSGYTYVWNIWVDWNNDGDFDDPGENVFTASSYSNSITTPVTIPAATIPGNKRLRIRNSYYSPVPPACGTNDYGEAEDYTLNVIALPPSDNAAAGHLITPDATPFCANSSKNVSVSIFNMGNNALNTVTVAWSVNGVEQVPVTGSVSLPNYSDSTVIALGPAFFPTTAPVAIKAWVYMPNGVPDNDNTNDTLTTTAVATLEGINIHIMPHDTAICLGSTVTLNAGTFPNGALYIWNNGSITPAINVSQPGQYSIKVQDNQGCSDRDTVVVSLLPEPGASAIALIDNGGGAFSISAIGAHNIDHYEWNFGDASGPVTGTGLPASQNHTYAAAGTYTVTLTISNECSEVTITETVFVSSTATGIDNLSALQQALKLFPNPARETVTLSHDGNLKMKTVAIFNLMGQNVYNAPKTKEDKLQINTSQLAAGIYNIVVDTDKGKITKKLEVIR